MGTCPLSEGLKWWLPIVVTAVLLSGSLWVLSHQARHVREKFLDVPYTTRLYYDAGLKDFVLGLPIADVQMSLTANDAACTYFADAARNQTCKPPSIDSISAPAAKGAHECASADAATAPKTASDSALTICGQLYRWTRTCRSLTFSSATNIDNTSPSALKLVLSRPVFLRAPRCALYGFDYGSTFLYQWPTPTWTLPLRQVKDAVIDTAANPSTLETVFARSVTDRKRTIAMPVTVHSVAPIGGTAVAACPAAAKVATAQGRAKLPLPASNGALSPIAEIGSQRLRIGLNGSKMTVQVGPSQTPDAANPPLKTTFALTKAPGTAIGYCWCMTSTGFAVLLSIDGGREVVLCVRQQQQDLLQGVAAAASSTCRLPDLNAALRKIR